MDTQKGSHWKRLILAGLVAVLLVAIPLSIAGTNSEPPAYANAYERVMAEDGFIYGIKVPWADGNLYACDIGAGQLPWNNKAQFSLTKWTEILTNCKAIGFNCVSIWLFEQAEGLVVNEAGEVMGVQEEFMTNLETLLDLAASMDINLMVTFQPHLSFAMYSYSPEYYTRFTQWAFDPLIRQQYLDRVVDPICALLENYRDHVVAVDVYAEPEGDVAGRLGNVYQPYGTTWENMADHIRAVGAKVREALPGIPVVACSGWQGFENLRRGLYNELGLDLIGMDIYNDYGDVRYDTTNTKKYESLKDLRLTKPAIVSEFGAISSKNWSDFFQTQTTLGMYESAREAGYVGAFYWMYGYPSSSESLTLVGPSGNFRPVVGGIRMMISQNQKDRSGDTSLLDQPAMLYNTDVLNIRWLGSRNVDHYRVERTEDMTNWTIIADNLDPTTVDPGTYLCTYQDQSAVPKVEYHYRVTAVDFDGGTKTSEPSAGLIMKKLFCTPEENAVGDPGFESGVMPVTSGDVPGQFVVYGSAVDSGQWGLTTEGVHEGNYALYVHGSGSWALGMYEVYDLKPNTEYTFTMWVKASSSGSDNSAWGVLENWSWNLMPIQHFIYDGEWRYYTIDFRTGAAGNNYRFYFGDGGGDFLFDDMYCFEK